MRGQGSIQSPAVADPDPVVRSPITTPKGVVKVFEDVYNGKFSAYRFIAVSTYQKKTDSIAAGVGTATGVGFPSEPTTVAGTGGSPSTQRPPRLAKGWGAGALNDKQPTVRGISDSKAPSTCADPSAGAVTIRPLPGMVVAPSREGDRRGLHRGRALSGFQLRAR